MRIGKKTVVKFLTDTPRCSSLNYVDFTDYLICGYDCADRSVHVMLELEGTGELVELVFICDVRPRKKNEVYFLEGIGCMCSRM